MLSSSISLLWPQLTHITHISSQIVGPTMGTLLHLSLISWLGKSPAHSDCRLYAFCSDSPNSQVLLRAPQMLCSIQQQTISNLSPPMRWLFFLEIKTWTKPQGGGAFLCSSGRANTARGWVPPRSFDRVRRWRELAGALPCILLSGFSHSLAVFA